MYGKSQRVSETVSSNFPGVPLKLLAKRPTTRGAKRTPSATRTTRTTSRSDRTLPA
jgi:hypothetical protein